MASKKFPKTVTADFALSALEEWARSLTYLERRFDPQLGQLLEQIPDRSEFYESFPLRRVRLAEAESEVVAMNKSLLIHVWQFNDYVREALIYSKGLVDRDAKRVVADHVRQCTVTQRCAYMANTAKHVIVEQSEWGQTDQPTVTGANLLIPCGNGRWFAVAFSFARKLTGRFPPHAIQTCNVVLKDGRHVWDTRWHVEVASLSWLKLIERQLLGPWVHDTIDRVVSQSVDLFVSGYFQTYGSALSMQMDSVSIESCPRFEVLKRPLPVAMVFPERTQNIARSRYGIDLSFV
jgi:hypothetical protein